METVHLTRKQLEEIKKNKIGEGTDACVYKIGKNILYKIYHDHRLLTAFLNDDGLLDSEGVRIAQKEDLKKYNEHASIKQPVVRYVDKDGVRLCSETAILKAMERQSYIKTVDLPQAPIYVDGHFKGCVLINQPGHDLHRYAFLPRQIKARIMLNILEQVDELVNNYIYPIDLCNKPTFGNSKKSHSNILLTKNLKPHLIDVDGKSAIYRESATDSLLEATLLSLNNLIIEFLYKIDLPDELEDADLDYLREILLQKCFSYEDAQDLSNFKMPIWRLKELLKEKTLIKK